MSAAPAETPAVSDEKVFVGNLTFTTKDGDLKHIHEKIGNILEAQVILRGDASLGFAHVKFVSESDAATATAGADDIEGPVKLNKRSRTKTSTRKRRGGAAGRARRSADDEHDEPAATSEEAAQNGQTSVKAVTDGLKAARIDGNGADAGDDDAKKQRQAAKKQAQKEKLAAARTAKAEQRRAEAAERRANSTPSKTLIFIRGLPFSFTQELLESLLKSSDIAFSSTSMPVVKGGFRSGSSRGYAFATVASEEDQKKGIEILNGKQINAEGGAPLPDEPEEEKAATAAEEGEKPAGEKRKSKNRKYTLSAREGYEDEEKTDSKAGGPDDSGVAEINKTGPQAPSTTA